MNTTADVPNAGVAKKEDGGQTSVVMSANVAAGGNNAKSQIVNAQSANLKPTKNCPLNLWSGPRQGISLSVTEIVYATAANFALGHIATGTANARNAIPKSTVGRCWHWRKGMIVRSWLRGGMS